jgi:hypothetical protein
MILAMSTGDFFLSMLASLIASFVFLLLILFLLRPALKISNNIVLTCDDDGKDCYRIKFYNTSIFSAYDADVSLIALEDRPAEPKGKHIYYQDLKLAKSNFTVIFRWLPMVLTKTYAHNCTQVKTYEDLTGILKHPNKSLQIKVTLRHGLTGLSKTFVKNYHTEAVLEKGKFAFGNSFKVITNHI